MSIFTDNGAAAMRRTKYYREVNGAWEWIFAVDFDGPCPSWYGLMSAPRAADLTPLAIRFRAPRAYRDCDVCIEFDEMTEGKWAIYIASDDPAGFALPRSERSFSRSADAFKAARESFGVEFSAFEVAS